MKSRAVQALSTLLVAYVAAQVAVWVHAPIPWMLGPLLVTAFASIRGWPVRSLLGLRNMGQWVIGSALGLYFTAEVGQMLLGLWWVILLGVVWALGAGWALGRWLERRHAHDLADLSPEGRRATTFLASAIGGASEMTLLAERSHARTDLVAAAHSLRMMVVVTTVPLAMQLAQLAWGLKVDMGLRPVAQAADWPALLQLAGVTLAGVAVMRWTGGANPWFMGALLASMGMTSMGWVHLQMPGWISNLAQLVVGVGLGVRFSPAFVRTAPRWMGSVMLGTLALLLGGAVVALVLAVLSGLHPATLILSTSPGGVTEMSITAKVLQLGAPTVTAMHVTRLVAVLMLARPLLAWQHRQEARQGKTGHGRD